MSVVGMDTTPDTVKTETQTEEKKKEIEKVEASVVQLQPNQVDELMFVLTAVAAVELDGQLRTLTCTLLVVKDGGVYWLPIESDYEKPYAGGERRAKINTFLRQQFKEHPTVKSTDQWQPQHLLAADVTLAEAKEAKRETKEGQTQDIEEKEEEEEEEEAQLSFDLFQPADCFRLHEDSPWKLLPPGFHLATTPEVLKRKKNGFSIVQLTSEQKRVGQFGKSTVDCIARTLLHGTRAIDNVTDPESDPITYVGASVHCTPEETLPTLEWFEFMLLQAAVSAAVTEHNERNEYLEAQREAMIQAQQEEAEFQDAQLVSLMKKLDVSLDDLDKPIEVDMDDDDDDEDNEKDDDKKREPKDDSKEEEEEKRDCNRDETTDISEAPLEVNAGTTIDADDEKAKTKTQKKEKKKTVAGAEASPVDDELVLTMAPDT